MSQQLAGWLVTGVGAYLALGLLFAVFFLLRGVDRIDPVAAASSWGFRVMILPGTVALWPMLLRRWLAGAGPPLERNAHRAAARPRSVS